MTLKIFENNFLSIFLLFQLVEQQVVLSSTLNYSRNVVSPEQAFQELIQKFNLCNLER